MKGIKTVKNIIGSILPKKIIETAEKYLIYAGIKNEPKEWLSLNIIIILEWALVGFVLFSFYYYITHISLSLYDWVHIIMIGGIGFVVFGIITTLLLIVYLYYKIVDRTNRINAALPDFLMVLSANTRAGMIPFEALKASSLKEFGPLKEEIDYIIQKGMGSASMSELLNILSKRTYSSNVKSFVNFFNHAIRSGGKIAETLETAANEMRKTKELKTRLWTNVRGYVIFLLFIVLIGLPFLLSISKEYIVIFESIQETSGNIKETIIIINPSINISEEFIKFVALVSIIGTSFFVSVTVGVLQEGRLFYGIKYWPIISIVSYSLFLLFCHVLESFFGGIL